MLLLVRGLSRCRWARALSGGPAAPHRVVCPVAEKTGEGGRYPVPRKTHRVFYLPVWLTTQGPSADEKMSVHLNARADVPCFGQEDPDGKMSLLPNSISTQCRKDLGG